MTEPADRRMGELPSLPLGDGDQLRRRGADQTLSDADQTLSDADQTRSDSDGEAAERDSVSSAKDQTLSDRDQATADRDRHGDQPYEPDDEERAYERGRAERARVSTERDAIQLERSRTGDRRDVTAEERDAIAAQRDTLAVTRDEEATELERSIAPYDAQLAARFEQLRRQAAADRAEAARDRARAARDRAEGARARARVEAELLAAHVDGLTGAYRREMGRIAMSNEIDRARRGNGQLVVAFVDLDGLKSINDTQGHEAGDDALRTVVSTLRVNLRSFDPVFRYGGDEFVVGMCDFNRADATRRFEAIQESLVETGIRISMGMAVLEPDDTVDTLIARADADLVEGRRHAREAQDS